MEKSKAVTQNCQSLEEDKNSSLSPNSRAWTEGATCRACGAPAVRTLPREMPVTSAPEFHQNRLRAAWVLQPWQAQCAGQAHVRQRTDSMSMW